MKRDAEEYASEDEKRRSAAENNDTAVFQAEKLMRDLGEKITPEEKGRVNSKIDAIRTPEYRNVERCQRQRHC